MVSKAYNSFIYVNSRNTYSHQSMFDCIIDPTLNSKIRIIIKGCHMRVLNALQALRLLVKESVYLHLFPESLII